jgi:hypothetical protein
VVVRAPAKVDVRGSICGLTHTPPEMWAITRSTMPVPTVSQVHEVSKHPVRVASWSAERIGPTIIAAPQRGQAHVDRVVVSGMTVAVASVDDPAGVGVARRVRASATRAARQVFARNPDCRMRTKPRGKMCWTKRRRNSMAESVIVRRWSPWA